MTIDNMAVVVGFIFAIVVLLAVACIVLLNDVEKIKAKERKEKQSVETREIVRQEMWDVLDYYFKNEEINNESKR